MTVYGRDPAESSPRSMAARLQGRGLLIYLQCAFHCICLAILILATFERPAFAYTDPGTGALIWQMVAAGFVGLAFYFRRFLSWFKSKRNVQPGSKNAKTPQHTDDNVS